MFSFQRFLAIACVIAIVIGVAIFALAAFLQLGKLSLLVGAVGAFGWLSVSIILIHNLHIYRAVEQAIDSTKVTESRGTLSRMVKDFTRESSRQHRASFAFRLDIPSDNASLGTNLCRIVHLAYTELGAKAVELALFEEESGSLSQAMFVGTPSSMYSQVMLMLEGGASHSKLLEEVPDSNVIVRPVSFAGTLFGALRVEFPKERVPSAADLQVANLLAMQGGVLLVDARFTDELLRMRSAGDESTRAKTGFLANLSHEIRGPLGIILNGAELFMEGLCGPVTDLQRETLRMIKDSGNHLLDLVNDVLDYAKIEAGKVTIAQVEIPLKDLLEDLVAVVRSEALAKRHKLVLEPVEATLGALCDKRHIRQILINFLTNAVKYTPDNGSVTVWAKRIPGNRVKIFVKDTGIGIPENQRHKVFGAFERVDNEYALAQTGTGLGMPLSRSLAEFNNGNVGFDSDEGKGSTFWLVLTAVEVSAVSGETEAAGTAPSARCGNGETVLLVDHDVTTRQMLERYLEEQGFHVVPAGTPSEVMRQLKENNVALAIIENDMPELKGEDMIAAVRSSPKAAAVPVILLSARAFVFDIERFLKLGVDRCLSKPVSMQEVALTSRRLIDQSHTLQKPQAPQPPV